MSHTSSGVSICVLVYGDHFELAERCLNSLIQDQSEVDREIIVGANAPSPATAALLTQLKKSGSINQLILSQENINKCPMMARMLRQANHDLVWWFDDDSHIVSPRTMDRWVAEATGSPSSTVQWGQLAWCDHALNFTHMNEAATHAFIRSASWYRGLPLPSWRPGGKGEFDHQGKGTGDGRWYFATGGCWMARKVTLETLNWPDSRLVILGEDVFLGEAIRQQGWHIANTKAPGVKVNDHPSRGTRKSDNPIEHWLPRLATDP